MFPQTGKSLTATSICPKSTVKSDPKLSFLIVTFSGTNDRPVRPIRVKMAQTNIFRGPSIENVKITINPAGNCP
jgi:hypothetical protein